MKTEYGVVCQQVVGGDGRPFEIEYNFDLRLFGARSQAVQHGFKVRDSDDFNIITVKGGELTGFWWMHEDLSDGHDLTKMASEFGFTHKADKPATGKERQG